jgi:Nif-specific regulatory protein
LKPYIRVVDQNDSSEQSLECGSLALTEKFRIKVALERHRGVQSLAAEELGITPRQIGYKIKKFGLEEFVGRTKES